MTAFSFHHGSSEGCQPGGTWTCAERSAWSQGCILPVKTSQGLTDRKDIIKLLKTKSSIIFKPLLLQNSVSFQSRSDYGWMVWMLKRRAGQFYLLVTKPPCASRSHVVRAALPHLPSSPPGSMQRQGEIRDASVEATKTFGLDSEVVTCPKEKFSPQGWFDEPAKHPCEAHCFLLSGVCRDPQHHLSFPSCS